MTTFNKVVSDIKSLEIQGAENIAKKAVHSLIFIVQKSKARNSRELYSELTKAKKKLFETRPTEPAMRNAIDYVLYNINTSSLVYLTQEVIERVNNVLNFFKLGEEKIAKVGAEKIKDNMIVFTHCHSSTVMNILKEAKKQGKNFTVYNTETRPLYQGRITAKELAKEGIKVHHFIDSSARLALKEADIALFGCDAITTDRIYNKIGTELFCEIAKKYDAGVYFCTNSWKFDAKSIVGFDEAIEERNEDEVWKNPPKNVTIKNYAFEKISPDLIDGIISELGIYRHNLFINELKENYPWIFKN